MELRFRGGSELLKLVIDRGNKKLEVASSKTSYKLTPTDWKGLFDKGRERIQERITDKLNDEEFKKIIVISLAQKGYTLIDDGNRKDS